MIFIEIFIALKRPKKEMLEKLHRRGSLEADSNKIIVRNVRIDENEIVEEAIRYEISTFILRGRMADNWRS